jgi:phage terminase large subunit-like protein
MERYQKKYHTQIEITDLIAEAVSNATARRNQVLDSEEFLSALSDEQTRSLSGGQFSIISDYQTCGMQCPDETLDMITMGGNLGGGSTDIRV